MTSPHKSMLADVVVMTLHLSMRLQMVSISWNEVKDDETHNFCAGQHQVLISCASLSLIFRQRSCSQYWLILLYLKSYSSLHYPMGTSILSIHLSRQSILSVLCFCTLSTAQCGTTLLLHVGLYNIYTYQFGG